MASRDNMALPPQPMPDDLYDKLMVLRDKIGPEELTRLIFEGCGFSKEDLEAAKGRAKTLEEAN